MSPTTSNDDRMGQEDDPHAPKGVDPKIDVPDSVEPDGGIVGETLPLLASSLNTPQDNPRKLLAQLGKEYGNAFRKGDFNKALELGEQLTVLAQETFGANSLQFAETICKRGCAQLELGHFPAAIDSLKASLQIVDEEHFTGTQAERLTFKVEAKLGIIYFAHQNFRTARPYLERALDRLESFAPRRIGPIDDVAVLKLHCADCMYECKELKRAEHIYRGLIVDLLNRYPSKENRELSFDKFSEPHRKLIMTMIAQHDVVQATREITNYRKFIKAHASSDIKDDRDSEAQILLAEISIIDGRYEVAHKICTPILDDSKAMRIFISLPLEARAHFMLGIVAHLANNDYSTANTHIAEGIRILQDSLEGAERVRNLFKSMQSSTNPEYRSVGAIFSMLTQESPLSKKFGEAALEEAEIAEALFLLARVLSDRAAVFQSKKDWAEAERCLERASSILTDVGQGESIAMENILESRARILEEQCRNPEATEFREKAAILHVINDMRRPTGGF